MKSALSSHPQFFVQETLPHFYFQGRKNVWVQLTVGFARGLADTHSEVRTGVAALTLTFLERSEYGFDVLYRSQPRNRVNRDGN
jgi:fibro-slime domain-containing protein